MFNSPAMIDELYRYNLWANSKILSLCDGLTDAQLDQPREMGFGSLRNTVFHILAAEEVWVERWKLVPWRPFPTDAGGMSLMEIGKRLRAIDNIRRELIDQERASQWQRVVEYKDSKGNAYTNRLEGLLVHVANHGIHHRAQALSYLRQFGKTVPGGIDYIFFRFARPLLAQSAETQTSLKQYGMEVGSGGGVSVEWDQPAIARYFAYGDWANTKLINLAATLDDAALDRSHGMGIDTIRKTILHIQDAERWWVKNWTTGPAQFEHSAATTSVAETLENWQSISTSRNTIVNATDAEGAHRAVGALIGPMMISVQVIESMMQLCGHGTHHRAQLVNMLRHSGITPPAVDYLYWLRENQI